MTVIPSVNVPLLGISVTPLRREELLSHIEASVRERRRMAIAGHNLHSVYLWHNLPDFRDFYARASAVIIDGMPVLALLRTSPGSERDVLFGSPHLEPAAGLTVGNGKVSSRVRWSTQYRLGSTDWVDGLTELESIKRVTTLGGTPAAALAVQSHFESLGRNVSWQSIPADPWRDEDFLQVSDRIRAHDPQVLLIGMGMPLQERLADAFARELEVPVIATVGGALDQLGGVQSLAPRQLGAWGFEWLWRLASDPKRLGGRYLLEPFKLAALLMRKAL